MRAYLCSFIANACGLRDVRVSAQGFASRVQHAPDVSAVAAQLKVAIYMHPCRHPRGNRQGEEAERPP